VVAEGIETTEQLEYLKAHGCQVFQGYLHGRPVACEELLATLLPR
jgi:EAL domain-containing protein (putative c-di-GMP-specific phosphodiesterase class I)